MAGKFFYYNFQSSLNFSKIIIIFLFCIGPVWKYSSNSATGFGVKLLVDYLLHVDKKNYLKK